MRFRTLLLASALLIGAQGFAQNSNFNGLNYQAVVRNTSGDPLPNQAIGVQFVVSCGSLQPYIESHAVTSDATGLITLSIGQGTPQFGSNPFTSINWAGCGQWEWSLNVAMDLAGGTNYQVVGAMPFKAVPFALNAASLVNPPQTGWVVTGNDVFKNNGGSVGIGTGIPTAKLDVAGTFKLVDGSQGANKVLTSDADGLATWATPSSTATGWSLSGNNLLNTNSGNVGIGTATPGSKLDVVGSGARILSGGSGTTSIAVGRNTTPEVTLGVAASVNNYFTGTSVGDGVLRMDNPANKLVIGAGIGTASTLVVTSANVGIGTTTPTDKLNVRTATSNYGFTHSDGTVTVGSFVGGSSGGGLLGTKSNHKLHFFTNNSTAQMTVATDGSVGIGTTTPAQKLDVTGSIQCTGHVVFNAANGVLDYGPGGSLFIRSLFTQGDISTYTDRLMVASNGNVGIGTITPQSKLAVNGKITCKEVDVTLAGFPDYVFEKDYRLMPLAEVEAYIAANGHLPNVPSACEVEENGLGLGEMNKILLEKVEELTLHLIEKDRRLEEILVRLGNLESKQNSTLDR